MGSRAGKPNKATKAREEIYAKQGITPLGYMLEVLRDEGQPSARRDEMAKAAAPYVHPKLASAVHQHSGIDGKPIQSTITVQFVKAKDGGETT